MTRLNDLVPCKQRPANPNWSDNGSKQTFMQEWPKAKVEPHGNPAYEGYGYPAAGYGQRRNKVVGLALPKTVNPQLVGWEQPQPQMKLVTVGTLNPKSDANTREVVGTLAGLGCACSPVDNAMRRTLNGYLNGLGQTSGDFNAAALAKAIVAASVPSWFINQLTEKILDDERLNAKAYVAVQQLKQMNSPRAAELQKQQEFAWGQTNTAKFYALLLPQMQVTLGFTSGKPKVTPPDYRYIRGGTNAGTFAAVAAYLRDAAVSNAAKDLIAKGYMKDSLGAAQFVVIPIAIAVVVAAGVLAYMTSQNASNVYAASLRELQQLRADGRISQADYERMVRDIQDGADKVGGSGTSVEDMVKYAGIGLGALVVLQVLSNLRTLIPSR